MLRAVIFDFDGVITDTEVLHLRGFNKVLAQYNIKISTADYYRDYLGLSDFDLFTLFAAQGRITADSEQIANLITQKNKVFEEMMETDGRIIEGVRDCLEMLGDGNIPIAICSGALLVEIEFILEQARLRDFFKIIVSAEQVRKGKPDPEGFLLTLKKLNYSFDDAILPSQCVVIEDSYWGLEAAKAAGMHTVAITNSYDAGQLSIAEKTIDHLSQLTVAGLQELCG